eukprot:scaffold3267_cov112-Isochrysis_galbana.AAC.4
MAISLDAPLPDLSSRGLVQQHAMDCRPIHSMRQLRLRPSSPAKRRRHIVPPALLRHPPPTASTPAATLSAHATLFTPTHRATRQRPAIERGSRLGQRCRPGRKLT